MRKRVRVGKKGIRIKPVKKSKFTPETVVFAIIPLTMFNKKYDFTTIIQEEDGLFVATVPAVPGCHAQGETYEEVQNNIKEALELCLEEAKHNDWYAQRIAFSIFNLPVKVAIG